MILPDRSTSAAVPQGLSAARRAAMALCARASRAELQDALAAIGHDGTVEDLRRPEAGLVMVRGRVGGDGGPFNVGEATVSRAAVRIGGAIGFAWQLGRDTAKARLAAMLDALLQTPVKREAVAAALHPIGARLAAEAASRARQTAATRVDFFTMLRGED
jgi:alpha-D-ribose 1-methylphosphonate 5-triphosphate synthase subunit PhnG